MSLQSPYLAPVLIGGPGRSGTTVLEQIVAKHTNIVALHNLAVKRRFPGVP